jgi:hypothetical protein
MDKNIWGKHFWFTIHYAALGYPKDASTEDKKNYKNFYEIISKVLPCDYCSSHYEELLKEIPVDNFLDNRDKLFEWTVIIHNRVNRDLKKPEWELEDAKNFYVLNHGPKNIKNYHSNKIIIFISIILFILLIIKLKKNKKIKKLIN